MKLAALLTLGAFTMSANAASIPVAINVDVAKTLGEWKPIYRFFGADEPNYATMKDGRKLLRELGGLGTSQVYFRAHNLLTTGDGTPALKWGSTNAYREDAQGNPIYDWTILDGIFDEYLKSGIKPYVQIGFMPKALSIKPEPYQHKWTPQAKYDEIYTGWAYPPKDYKKWEELVYQWTRHCLERYGRAETESWYWQVWNEANIGYWRGTPEEFRKLHDYAIAGVKRALPTARVGGPDWAGSGGKLQRDFLEHCLRGTNYATGQIGTPLDFVSFHAKGAPQFVDGHVRMGIAAQLRTIDDGFKIVASFPELKNKPIIIGESDPEGCAACQGPQLAYRNGTMYSSYTAASFARKIELAERHGVNLEGALTWAFEFEDQPYFAGFRALATNSINLPVLNVFRMMGKLRGQRLQVQSSGALSLDDILKNGVRAAPDIAALATRDEKRICILAWHYHDDDVPGATAEIDLRIGGAPDGTRLLRQFVVDETHSNAFTLWKKIGAPQQPTLQQYRELEAAGQLSETAPRTVTFQDGTANVKLNLPRQAVALLVIE
jgi:xylan 1,4-beta-xylosidase